MIQRASLFFAFCDRRILIELETFMYHVRSQGLGAAGDRAEDTHAQRP
jgi:hypothetical protein